jgi:hypothetical protein
MSVGILTLSRPPQTHALGQLFGRHGEAYLVFARVREQPQSVEEAQGLEHSGIDADTYGVVALFNAP